MMGGDADEHWEERAKEIYKRKKAAERWTKEGITVEAREMVMITPNETAETPEPPTPNGNPQD